MKLIPKIFPGKKSKSSELVVLDIGLGRVNIAIFQINQEGPKFIGVGRRSFTTNDSILDATFEATDALGAIIEELPTKAIIGVSGGQLEALTTIAKYSREKPNSPINKDEITQVLKKISSENKENLKVFFSTITGGQIDESKVTNPIGVKGEKVELSCFIAYKPESEISIYEKIIDDLELKPDKIIPTSYALSKMLAKKEKINALLLRVGKSRSEAAEIHDGQLMKVTNFDLGTDQLEFYKFAIETLLEKQEINKRSEKIFLYADSDECNLDEVQEVLEKANFKKNLKLGEELKIDQLSGEGNFGPADMGLLSLSAEETNTDETA